MSLHDELKMFKQCVIDSHDLHTKGFSVDAVRSAIKLFSLETARALVCERREILIAGNNPFASLCFVYRCFFP